jgi:hypothetical protein
MKKLLLVLNLLFFTATVVVAEIYPSAYTQEQRELHGYMQKQRQLKKQCTENPYANRLYFRASIKAIVEFRRIQTDIQDVAEDIELNNILPEAKSTLGTLEKQLRKDVRALNNQIEENARLIAEGRAGATTYIVDLRKANKQPAFLDEPKIAEVNTKLQQINQATGSTKVAFYVLLNMYYPDSNVSINGESREDYLKRYITELYQRSKLTTNGILLNIESFIRLGDIRTANSGTGSITTVPSKFLLSYHPYVALGRDLKETSIDELIKTNIVDIGSRPGFEFAVQGAGTSANKPHRGEVLDKYVSAIDDVLKGKTADFFASETGSEYFAELKLPADQRQQMIAKFTTANTSPKVTDRLKDYAGVEIFLQRLFGNYYSQLSTNLTDKLNLSIITTSDKNTRNGVNAIQLVKEAQPTAKNLVIGIHFLEPENSSSPIRVRYAISYGGDYGDLIKEELHHVWSDIRLLDYSDQAQAVSQGIFKKFNEVLDVINEALSGVRIPDSWWNTDSLLSMDPLLAGVINAILDNVAGIVEIGTLALKLTASIQYYTLQAILYAHEIDTNSEKREQLKAELNELLDNWFPILKGGIINTIAFLGSIDSTEDVFGTLTPDQQLALFDRLENATTVKELALSAGPFFMAFNAYLLKAVGQGVKALVTEGWDKLTSASLREIRYYTGYVIIQVVGCFFGVSEAMAILKGTKTAIQIVDKVTDSIKALNTLAAKAGDDMVVKLRMLFNDIREGIDYEAVKKFISRLSKKSLESSLANLKNLFPKLLARGNLSDEVTASLMQVVRKANPDKLRALAAKIDDMGDDGLKLLGDLSGDLGKNLDWSKFDEGLVESWKVFNDANLSDAVRKNPSNLERLSKAIRQNGYKAAYFETLLKSKTDPQKFIDDYVSKLGSDGKFVDIALENDYAGYVSRKAREGKAPRDRSDWNEASDYFKYDSPVARGNAFNETARIERWYPFNEVVLSNGKRVDSYRLPEGGKPGEIVSRKATDLGDIQLSTFESYLSEMKTKYAPGTPINSPKYGDLLKGKTLEGNMILELPDSNLNLPDIQDYIDLANSKGITLRFKPE